MQKAQKKEKLIIIDGNSLAYRAFFALPESIITTTGTITNSVYGFTNMLINLINDEKPTMLAVAFDSKEPTFRHEAYKDYKSNRERMPEDLANQLDLIENVLNVFNIPIYRVDGYEADDILGTLALQAENKGIKVLIVTGDKDTLQLVSEDIKVLFTIKGISNVSIFGPDDVIKKYGIDSKYIPDYFGLVGDKIDNIPGIAGIGKKTATKLINSFGSLEKIFFEVDKIQNNKIKSKLEKEHEIAILSKKLATIDCNAPVKIDIKKCKLNKFEEKKVYGLFDYLEFKTLWKKLKKLDLLKESTKEKDKLHCLISFIDNEKKLTNLIEKIKQVKEIAIQFLCNNDLCTGISISIKPDKSFYIHIDSIKKEEDFFKLLRSILMDSDIKKIMHKAKNQLKILFKKGITLQGLIFDSYVASYLLRPHLKEHELSEIIQKYLGYTASDFKREETIGHLGLIQDEIWIKKKAEIEGRRTSALLVLKNILETILISQDMEKLFYEVEIPLIDVLAKLELWGVKIDKNYLNNLNRKYQDKISTVTKKIYKLSGQKFNINSPQQLGKILFEKLKLTPFKRTKTGYATGFSVLKSLEKRHPIIKEIIDYRELSKLKSTYIDALSPLINENNGRIHTTFHQTGTVTGRLSSSDPNLQNIPIRTELGREIRKAFIADEGCILLEADYSQVELRILAHLSEDENLINAFKKDVDFHKLTASQLFNIKMNEVTPQYRRAAKAINFGIIYGMTKFGLASRLNISEGSAENYIEQYFNRYPRVRDYIDNIIEEARKNGYVKTILNRRRYVPEIKSSNPKIRQVGERFAINAPIQGSAADIIKIAMINIYKEILTKNYESRIVLQVHDELVLEVPIDEKNYIIKLVREKMEKAYPLKVKLKVDMKTGNNWYM
jgi:DNA polymerase-1